MSTTNSDDDSDTTLRHRKSSVAVAPAAATVVKAKEDNYDQKLKVIGAGESKMRKFLVRFVTTWLMIFGFLGLIYLGHAAVLCLVVLIQTRIYYELGKIRYHAASARKVPLFRTLMWGWFGAAMYMIYGLIFIDYLRVSSSSRHRLTNELLTTLAHYHSFVSFSLLVVVFVLTVLNLKKDAYRYQIGQWSWTVTTVCITVFQVRFLVSNIMAGLFWFLLPCSLVICNDIMAYMCGLLGKGLLTNRPLLALSPNKTWEGFLGGMLLTTLFALSWPLVLMRFQWLICPLTDFSAPVLSCVPNPVFVETQYTLPWFLQFLGTTVSFYPVQLHSLALGLFASVIAPFGGFFASAIKRAYKVKDFDQLIPGHGGMTDRMDCQLLMALATSVHYKTFIEPLGASAIESIMQSVLALSTQDQLDVLARLNALLYPNATITN